MGVPVRIGRWRIPGSPLTVLVEFSGLFAEKDAILARLWEDSKVDSIEGQWDYVEPVTFGWAAGRVIEAWWKERVEPEGRAAVAQFHEWMVGSGMLYLKTNAPAIGTIFTTHATMLGRSLSSTGKLPEEGLAGRTPDEAARASGIRAKHSLEGVCVREADVFTTVSKVTAKEAALFFGRHASPLLPERHRLARDRRAGRRCFTVGRRSASARAGVALHRRGPGRRDAGVRLGAATSSTTRASTSCSTQSRR
jgi:phosphorylase/glycogen(starch) synthase